MVDKRARRTRADILALRQAIADIVEENRPLTIRHLFYLMVARALIEKTEREYKQVTIRLAGEMREDWLELAMLMERFRNGKGSDDDDGDDGDRNYIRRALKLHERPVIPFGHDYIVDAGRWIRKPQTYTGIEAALRDTAECYRRSLWHDQPIHLIFLCEKDAIADLVYGETGEWDVALSVLRGDSSKTFLWEIADAIKAVGKPAKLFLLGDYDVKGRQIIDSAVERIRRYAPNATIDYEVLAITEEQIAEYNLPTRPEKTDASQDAVEIDALPPEILRQLINQAILQHFPKAALEVLRKAEESERAIMIRIAADQKGGGPR